MTAINMTDRRRTSGEPLAAPEAPGGFSLHEKIDVCRGLFAALVVMAHSLEISWGIHRDAMMDGPPLQRMLVFGIFGTGTYYVMGFFVLSGYCIHLSVARSMDADRFPLKRYTIARLSRILPLYYLALLATVPIEWLIAGARPIEWPHGIDRATFLGQIVMIQNMTQRTFGSFAASWSITNEVFYYLLYGVLAWLLARSRLRPAWVGMGLCAALAVVGQVLYVTGGRHPYVYRTGMMFGLGMLWFQGALVAVHGRDLIARPWVRRVAACWPLLLAATFGWKTLDLPANGFYPLAGWAFTLMLLNFLRTPNVAAPTSASPWRKRFVTTLGLSSYPMYLFHGPLLMLAGSVMMRLGLATDWRLTWGLLLVLGITSGTALGWLVERPLMDWRASLLRRPNADLREPAAAPHFASRPVVAVGVERV